MNKQLENMPSWPTGYVDFSDRTMPPWNYYVPEPGDVVVISTEDAVDDDHEVGECCYLDRYQGTPNDPRLLEDAKGRNELSKVIQQFGTWVVTTYGMESLTWQYAIISGRLGRDEPHRGWIEHMRRKFWVNVVDFGHCYEAAVNYHDEHTSWPRPTTSISHWQLFRDLGFRPKRTVKSENGATAKVIRGRLRLRFLILKRDNYHCRLCGRGVEDGIKLHVDHIIARAKGGPMTEANLHVLCSECNIGKGTDTL